VLRSFPRWFALILILGIGFGLTAAEPNDIVPTPIGPELADYRTVETAITPAPGKATTVAPDAVPAFLGVSLADTEGNDGPVVAEVAAESPAARAGLKPGDVLRRVGGQEVGTSEDLGTVLKSKAPGAALPLTVERSGKPVELTATLVPASRPIKLGTRRATLGVQVGPPKEGAGVAIEQVSSDSPASKAKLKVGEVILKIDGVALTAPDQLRDVLAEKKPDDTVTLTLLLAEKAVEMKVKLDAESTGDARGFGWDTRGGGGGGGGGRGMGGGGRYWSKDVFRLAVVCIEYPDAKHAPKIPTSAWAESFFSKGTYTKTNATGQPVYGSLNDYYLEQSFGKLRVEGKVFDFVEASKKRMDYSTGPRQALLTEALDLIVKREGKDALKDFDGVCYIYAGGRMQVARGSLYWPHRASVTYQGRSLPYFICPESGQGGTMGNISVYCHEFGHMLGLPDLYARPENPGSEGVGVWCAMSNQVGNGRPQQFCAWSKEKLGWVQPKVIDPAVKQKLVLGPIESSPRECLKVLLRPDGSEYLLLENRQKKGFDTSLPADGLLIWRVVQNRPFLVESHGVEGPAGPRSFLQQVPYPSPANDSLTPFTTPSSRSQLGGGVPVYVTNIRRLADGRVTFQVGYEYQ
jgi:M6 family metalloprotease-like protein